MSTSSVEQQSKSVSVLTVQLEAKEVNQVVRMVQASLSSKMNIPGFRRGKAPLGALKMAIGADRLQEEIKENILQMSYGKALQDQSLDPITIVKMETPDVKMDEPYSYTVEVEVFPKIELPNLSELGLKAPDVVVEDSEIDKAIEAIQKENATAEPVDRAIKAGDWVSFSITSVPEGYESNLEPIKEQRYVAKLDQRPEGDPFVQHFPGNKKGDFVTMSTSISSSFPVAELTGAEGDFTFEVHEVREPSLPAVDEELAARLRVESVDQLRETIQGIITRDKKREVDRVFNEEILDTLVKKTPVETSSDLVNREVEAVKANILSRGTMEDAAKHEGLSVDEFEKKLAADVEEDLKKQLILRQVAVNEKIAITEQEMMLAAQSLAMNARMDKGQFRNLLRNQNAMEEVRNRLVVEKTLKFLRDSVSGLISTSQEEQPS